LEQYIDEFNLKGDILLDKLRVLADGKTIVTLFDQFNAMALDVIAAVAFGMNTNTLSDPANKLNQYVTESLKGFFRFASRSFTKIDYLNPSEWLYRYKYRKVIGKLRAMGQQQILQRIKSLKEDTYCPSDLLGITLTKNGKYYYFQVSSYF
jgi:hypothetical protein